MSTKSLFSEALRGSANYKHKEKEDKVNHREKDGCVLLNVRARKGGVNVKRDDLRLIGIVSKLI